MQCDHFSSGTKQKHNHLKNGFEEEGFVESDYTWRQWVSVFGYVF